MKQLLLLVSVVAWVSSTTIVWWFAVPVFSPSVVMLIGMVAGVSLFIFLLLRFYLAKHTWLKVWLWGSPPIVSSVAVIIATAAGPHNLSFLLLLAVLLLVWPSPSEAVTRRNHVEIALCDAVYDQALIRRHSSCPLHGPCDSGSYHAGGDHSLRRVTASLVPPQVCHVRGCQAVEEAVIRPHRKASQARKQGTPILTYPPHLHTVLQDNGERPYRNHCIPRS